MQSAVKILFGFLALIYLSGSSYQLFLFVDYQVNKEAITEEFCVNKDKPELRCDGHCHLKQELEDVPTNAVDVHEKTERSPSYSLIIFDTFNELFYIDALSSIDSRIFIRNKHFENLYSFTWVGEMVHPPECV